MTLEEYRNKVDIDKATVDNDISILRTKVENLINDINSELYFKNTKKQGNMIDRATELLNIIDKKASNLEEI